MAAPADARMLEPIRAFSRVPAGSRIASDWRSRFDPAVAWQVTGFPAIGRRALAQVGSVADATGYSPGATADRGAADRPTSSARPIRLASIGASGDQVEEQLRPRARTLVSGHGQGRLVGELAQLLNQAIEPAGLCPGLKGPREFGGGPRQP